MDPVSMLHAGGLYVVTEIARRAGDDAVEALWGTIKRAWKEKFGSEPDPNEVSTEEVNELLSDDPTLKAEIFELWKDSPVLRRARHAEPLLRGAHVLWIDDHPEWNALERQFLEAFGLRILFVRTTDSALTCLDDERFDLIVSDIARGDNEREGIDALPQLRSTAPQLPVVFYVARLLGGGPPPGAFGITNRPSDLLHLCMDALERRS
jgi:hypothetical protein